MVSLKRVVHVGGTSYTHDIGTLSMGSVLVGDTFTHSFPRPKHALGATKYTWILTIDGEDPKTNDNTFKGGADVRQARLEPTIMEFQQK